MGRRGWITNPASQQYKQLEHVVSKMRGDFTAKDVFNFFRDRWDTEGLEKIEPSAITGKPLMQKRMSFKVYTISRFLQLYPEVEIVDEHQIPKVYRRKKNDR